MRRRQKSVLVFALSMSLVALTACGGGGSSSSSSAPAFGKDVSGTLKAWGFNNADDVGKARLSYAQSQMSGVSISMDETAFDAQKFTTRAASGNVPDVVQMDRQFVATYAAQGLIQPLDKCFSSYGVDPSKAFYPAVTGEVTYNGNIWAVPQFYQPAAIILNKRVMDAAGVSAAQIDPSKPDTLLAAAQKMYKTSGGNPSTLGFDAVPTGQPELWLLSYGGRLMDDKGVPALNDPNNAKALADLKRLTDAQGGWAKVKSFTDAFDTFGKNNQYVKDQVGAQVNAQWYVNVLTPYVNQIQISAVPFKDQQGSPFTVASGTSFVIPVGAKNPNAACAWMIHLDSDAAWQAAGAARAETLSKTPGSIFTGLFTGSPSADSLIRSKYVKPSGNAGFDETIATYYDIVDKGKSLGASPAGQSIKTELQNAITSALLGEKSPQQALSDAQNAAMRAYNQSGAGK